MSVMWPCDELETRPPVDNCYRLQHDPGFETWISVRRWMNDWMFNVFHINVIDRTFRFQISMLTSTCFKSVCFTSWGNLLCDTHVSHEHVSHESVSDVACRQKIWWLSCFFSQWWCCTFKASGPKSGERWVQLLNANDHMWTSVKHSGSFKSKDLWTHFTSSGWCSHGITGGSCMYVSTMAERKRDAPPTFFRFSLKDRQLLPSSSWHPGTPPHLHFPIRAWNHQHRITQQCTWLTGFSSASPMTYAVLHEWPCWDILSWQIYM